MSGSLNVDDVRQEFREMFHASICEECVALTRQVQMALTQELWRVFDEFRKEIREIKSAECGSAPVVESPPVNKVQTPPVGPSSPCPLLHVTPVSSTEKPQIMNLPAGTPQLKMNGSRPATPTQQLKLNGSRPVSPLINGSRPMSGARNGARPFSGSKTGAWPPTLRTAAGMGIHELPSHSNTEGVKRITLQPGSPHEPDHAPPRIGIIDTSGKNECQYSTETEIMSGTSDHEVTNWQSLRVGKRSNGSELDIKVHPSQDNQDNKLEVPSNSMRRYGQSINTVQTTASYSSRNARRPTYMSQYTTQLEVLPGDDSEAPDVMYEAWLPEKVRESFHPGCCVPRSSNGPGSVMYSSWAVSSIIDQRQGRLRFSGITKIAHMVNVMAMCWSGRVSASSLFFGFFYSEYFDYVMGLFVLLNAISIGIQVDYMARWADDDAAPTTYRIIDGAFCVIFVCELIARFCMQRCEYFYVSGWQWNVFDFVVVIFQVIDECAKLFLAGTSAQETIDSLGVLRMLRLARIMRLIRMVRLIPELRSMVYLLSASMWSFFWTAVLLLMLMFCVAVYFTEIATDLIQDAKVLNVEAVSFYYGSIGDSIRSLFQAISGGDDWRNFVEPFQGGDSYMTNTLIFGSYVAFTMLVMLNLVTGVFVDGAQKIVQQDKDQELIRHVRRLFQLTDQDENGEISWSEFEAQLETEKMEAYLDTVEIGKNEARALFKLLDTDRSGEVNVEEFVLASLKLRGPAKSVDLNALKYDFEEITAMWGMRFITIDLNLRKLLESMEAIAHAVSPDQMSQWMDIADMSIQQDLV